MKRILLFSFLLVAAVGLTAQVAMRAATGTLVSGVKSPFTFGSSPVRSLLIVSNRSASGPIYVKLNDGLTSAAATVSSSVFDFVVDANEEIILTSDAIARSPVYSASILTTATTPKVRVAGY